MARTPALDRWSLILAGGDGTRLQELTRLITGKPIPKQYCKLVGGRSLLEATLDRTRHFAPRERTLVVFNRDHVDLARDQLCLLPAENQLAQLGNRDTGPGLLFSLLHLARRSQSATVAVFPSDHYVSDDRAFVAHVEQAARIVTRLPNKIVLLGIRPDYCEPGYGYIETAEPLPDGADFAGAFHVAAFHEKPGPDTVTHLLRRGGLWNSFVMVFRLERMLGLLQRMVASDFERMKAIHARSRISAAAYRQLAAWNFSHRILARVPEHLVVLRVEDIAWSDWGTPEAIERTFATLKQTPPWRAAPQLAHPLTAAA
ncbi:MAG: NTP transferase domain-containing protein [Deltaproteobacteria bacterium]|nr:NTP transferase domain-containing protein [Deltaproteobacteria bacterium]